MNPDRRVLMRCFLRSYLVSANFNPKGRQNIGFLYTIDPALQVLYPQPKDLQRARKRYLKTFNSHPYFVPLLVGYAIFLEIHHGQELETPEPLQDYLETVVTTLSALGDSFFGGSLQIFWSLSLVLLIFLHQFFYAGLVMTLSFVALQLFRAVMFWRGWKDGLSIVARLQRMDLMRWALRFKIMNAFMVTWLVFLLFPSRSWWLLLIYGAYLFGVAFLSEKKKFSREIAVAAFLLIVLCYGVVFKI